MFLSILRKSQTSTTSPDPVLDSVKKLDPPRQDSSQKSGAPTGKKGKGQQHQQHQHPKQQHLPPSGRAPGLSKGGKTAQRTAPKVVGRGGGARERAKPLAPVQHAQAHTEPSPTPAVTPMVLLRTWAVNATDLMHARYRDWVTANSAAVHAATGGRAGYVHLPDMEEIGTWLQPVTQIVAIQTLYMLPPMLPPPPTHPLMHPAMIDINSTPSKELSTQSYCHTHRSLTARLVRVLSILSD